MAEKDRQQFRDAVVKAKTGFWRQWGVVMDPLFRLRMSDMLSVLDELSGVDRSALVLTAKNLQNSGMVDATSLQRLEFAMKVIDDREIADFGLANDEVNDGREFLGGTRPTDADVRAAIDTAMVEARAALKAISERPEYGRAIREWSYKGSADGEKDRRRCNRKASPPLILHR